MMIVVLIRIKVFSAFTTAAPDHRCRHLVYGQSDWRFKRHAAETALKAVENVVELQKVIFKLHNTV